MAGGEKIQGEAELSSVTNSSCGINVLGSYLSCTDRTLLSVTHIVVAQTFLELQCKLDKGLVRFGCGFVFCVFLCLVAFLFWLGFLDLCGSLHIYFFFLSFLN